MGKGSPWFRGWRSGQGRVWDCGVWDEAVCDSGWRLAGRSILGAVVVLGLPLVVAFLVVLFKGVMLGLLWLAGYLGLTLVFVWNGAQRENLILGVSF